jgi:ParB family chromosome partitioning protein
MVSDKLARLVNKGAQPIATESRLPLAQILDRIGGDTRQLNQAHVDQLAESIAALGLIQPIAVDVLGRLLAGGHRRAAIALLEESGLGLFPLGVPIRRFDFDAAKDPAKALAIEASENEKRRDYTPGEVRGLADRLRESGFEDLRGRPRAGQKSVVLALTSIIGKSEKTVRRYLAADTEKDGQATTFEEEARVVARSLGRLCDREDCPEEVAKLARRLLGKL